MTTSSVPQPTPLVKQLWEVLEAHEGVFGQERVFWRVVLLVLGELTVGGWHTVTQLLLSLGLGQADGNGWYRLFSRGRFREQAVAAVLFQESLRHVEASTVYVVAGDGVQVPRSSGRMEGSGWLKCPRNPPFKVGIHRAQRFFNGSWLLPANGLGYSRALPLRWLACFTEKATRQVSASCKEWQAGLAFLGWVRAQLDAAGRSQQTLLGVFDGSYDQVELWKGLPERVIVLARSAKNRCLYRLPPPGSHKNRKYGARAPQPQAYCSQRTGWTTVKLVVRGQLRRLVYRVEGPFVRQGAAGCPLWLIVVRGQSWVSGKHSKRRQPCFYLVNAVQVDGEWQLPLPADQLLFWAWQRWEVEVCHRALKTDFGLGDKQCWQPHAAVASVQWSAWVYSCLLLAGYRTWGLGKGPALPSRWWGGAQRWSFRTLAHHYRLEFAQQPDFQAVCRAIPTEWVEKESLLIRCRQAMRLSSSQPSADALFFPFLKS